MCHGVVVLWCCGNVVRQPAPPAPELLRCAVQTPGSPPANGKQIVKEPVLWYCGVVVRPARPLAPELLCCAPADSGESARRMDRWSIFDYFVSCDQEFAFNDV